MIDGKS
jgi:hypothetical protein